MKASQKVPEGIPGVSSGTSFSATTEATTDSDGGDQQVFHRKPPLNGFFDSFISHWPKAAFQDNPTENSVYLNPI